jgi:hypothetical protein
VAARGADERGDDHGCGELSQLLLHAHDPAAGGFSPAVMQQPDHCIVHDVMQRDSWQSFWHSVHPLEQS